MSDRLGSVARLNFLGALRIEIGNEAVTPEAERLFAMVVRLSVPLGRITSRQLMMELLWPGADEANARHSLRQTVYKAREMGLVVESGEDGLRLDPRHWSCDWEDPVGDVGGEWLARYAPLFSEEMMAWVTEQRMGVHALLRPRIMRSLQTARSAGDLSVANRYAVQLLGIDELNEEATLTHAEAMAMQGSKVDALKLLDGYLAEIGDAGAGRQAALPAQLLRRRIAEKLPAIAYQSHGRHHGALVGRVRESKLLTSRLFDARAGRGGGLLVHGPEGSGKSRLLYEMRKSAVLQGMRVVEHGCNSAASAMPFTAMRALVGQVMELPGALGISPESLDELRAWRTSNEFAPDDCPLPAIEDLLAAVGEETPLLLLLEHAERIDAESLGRLDRIYRRGVSRYHALVLASSVRHPPPDAPVVLQWLERLPLRPMTTVDVRAVVTAYAEVEQPRATQEQIACAAVFAEGVPMYGIEMLGLMLDLGSPDVIPWRVQVAVDRALRELSDVQWRVLALASLLGPAARHEVVEASLQVERGALTVAIDELEASGYLQAEDGRFRVSSLMADGAEVRLKPNVLRMDALRGAQVLAVACDDVLEPQQFYACMRLYIRARDETRAEFVCDRHIASLLRLDTAQSIVYELREARRSICTAGLESAFDVIVDRVRSGSESRKPSIFMKTQRSQPKSLPAISRAHSEVEHTLVSKQLFDSTISGSRNPDTRPACRLADAVMALFVSSNLNDAVGLDSAYRAVNAVRLSPDVSVFDICRADLIYHASRGNRDTALGLAQKLAGESRSVADIQMACRGLRNAADVYSTYGYRAVATGLLNESRILASELDYFAQIAWADIRLADIHIEELDFDGAREHSQSAALIIDKNRLLAPLLSADLHLTLCWESIIRGDSQAAQRAARVVARRFGTASGTPHLAHLAAKLATRGGAFTIAVRRDLSTLKASIGSLPFYSNEQMSLAALVLTTRDTVDEAETHAFVAEQIPRLHKERGSVWPFITQVLNEK